MVNSTFKNLRARAPKFKRDDFYHSLLKTPWSWVIFYYVLYFLCLNFFFAFLYFVVPNSLSLTHPSFLQCFFFSVQTFSTVGYGTVAPITNYANIVVSFEIVFGLISMAVSTGLIFAKFSKPVAKILFSQNILITNFNREKVLMFRTANSRNNQIFSAKLELFLLYTEHTAEGNEYTRYIPLKLQKDYTPIFGLSWSIFHTIDESSPLFEKSIDEMIKEDFEFLVLLNGMDDTYATNIQISHHYDPSNIIFDKHFEDILKSDDNGKYYLDYKNFNAFKNEDRIN